MPSIGAINGWLTGQALSLLVFHTPQLYWSHYSWSMFLLFEPFCFIFPELNVKWLWVVLAGRGGSCERS